MASYEPSPVELGKALDEVYYEIEQLAFTAELGTNHQGLANAIIESRLIHVRSLIDFFEVSACAKDDILAAHYGFAVSALPIEGHYRERLNKDLAHLTYSRTRRSLADKPWPHERVVLPVLERARTFVQHVLATRSTYGEHPRGDWEILLAALASRLEVSQSLDGV